MGRWSGWLGRRALVLLPIMLAWSVVVGLGGATAVASEPDSRTEVLMRSQSGDGASNAELSQNVLLVFGIGFVLLAIGGVILSHVEPVTSEPTRDERIAHNLFLPARMSCFSNGAPPSEGATEGEVKVGYLRELGRRSAILITRTPLAPKTRCTLDVGGLPGEMSQHGRLLVEVVGVRPMERRSQWFRVKVRPIRGEGEMADGHFAALAKALTHHHATDAAS